MIEVTEDKLCDLYENIEKSLKYLGKAMHYVEEIKSDERSSYKEYDDYDDYNERHGEREGMRKGMRGSGRYSKY